MLPRREKPKTVSEYVQAAEPEAQEKLWQLIECLRSAAPGASEAIKWGNPAFSYQWILFQFAAIKGYISFYPTPAAIQAFEQELGPYKTTSSTIRFRLDEPLPLELIQRIAAFRVRESVENGVKWM
jgi:uncharacterized protein YdhG (YjbR/CyaY superfamily)